MIKTDLMYEGKAKKVWKTDNEDYVIVEYKDDATAFNGLKKGTIQGKGIVNNKVANRLFKYLEGNGVATHFVEELSDRETLVKKVEIIPVEVVVRNIAAGGLSKRLGIPEGTKLKSTVLEYCYKNDGLGDPMINEYHAFALGICTAKELENIAYEAFKINKLLSDLLADLNIDLIAFKLEFGRFHGKIVLADEISPDTCRFWDSKTGEKLDKDRFRRDLGNVKEAYLEVMNRLLGD